MRFLTLALLLAMGIACSMAQTPPPPTTDQLQTFLDNGTLPSTQELQAKLTQVEQDNDDLRDELRHREDVRFLAFFFGLGVLPGAIYFSQRFAKALTPQTMRGKQVAILIPMAIWTSACMIYQTRNEVIMRHPEEALFMALFYASPALLLGAVGVWWFSPWRTRKHPDKVERLFQAAHD